MISLELFELLEWNGNIGSFLTNLYYKRYFLTNFILINNTKTEYLNFLVYKAF